LEFLANYGLFLAKAVTVLVVVVLIIMVIAANAMRSQKGSEEHVEIRKINDDLDDLEDAMKDMLLDKDDLKRERKEKKRLEKAKKKERKKSGENEPEAAKRRVFVTAFDGDIKASQTEQLRKVISAILTVAKSEDEVVVKLESAGGMVHSYGFASSQLLRLREAGVQLTVCVDKVAASGGYMMACVAHKIVAAPFAILGSIGVVAQLPNFNRLLEKHDVDYEMHTAGEYKRTLTMFGKNTDEGRKKFIEELEDTHVLFKQFIHQNRPSVNIEDTATGEIWFGTRALERQLIDSVQTSDDYLFALRKDADIFDVRVLRKKSVAERVFGAAETAVERSVTRLLTDLNKRYFA